MYEIVYQGVLRVEIERNAQVFAQRIETRLGSRGVPFDFGGHGNLAIGEFEEQVVSAELLGRRGEITHVPSVFGTFEYGLGLLFGRLDALGSGFVEQILLIEQTRGEQGRNGQKQ